MRQFPPSVFLNCTVAKEKMGKGKNGWIPLRIVLLLLVCTVAEDKSSSS